MKSTSPQNILATPLGTTVLQCACICVVEEEGVINKSLNYDIEQYYVGLLHAKYKDFVLAGSRNFKSTIILLVLVKGGGVYN